MWSFLLACRTPSSPPPPVVDPDPHSGFVDHSGLPDPVHSASDPDGWRCQGDDCRWDCTGGFDVPAPGLWDVVLTRDCVARFTLVGAGGGGGAKGFPLAGGGGGRCHRGVRRRSCLAGRGGWRRGRRPRHRGAGRWQWWWRWGHLGGSGVSRGGPPHDLGGWWRCTGLQRRRWCGRSPRGGQPCSCMYGRPSSDVRRRERPGHRVPAWPGVAVRGRGRGRQGQPVGWRGWRELVHGGLRGRLRLRRGLVV
jgi:hypothetical protein